MRHFFLSLYVTIQDFISAVVSSIAVVFFSSIRASKKVRAIKRHADKCLVLGNGPSLANEVERVLKLSQECDTICVNTIYKMDLFWSVKPRFYVFVDPMLFDKSDKTKKLKEETITAFKKIDWDMTLIIPCYFRKNHIVNELQSKYVKILFVNVVPVSKGLNKYRHFIYDKQLGMPKSQNVLNCVLYLTVLWKYKTVYLFGADHSWLKDLSVDDENYVLFGQRHAFDKKKEDMQLTRSKQFTMMSLLRDWANMFESHMLIQEYAESKGVSIINCTKNSFIDAYPRLIKANI